MAGPFPPPPAFSPPPRPLVVVTCTLQCPARATQLHACPRRGLERRAQASAAKARQSSGFLAPRCVSALPYTWRPRRPPVALTLGSGSQGASAGLCNTGCAGERSERGCWWRTRRGGGKCLCASQPGVPEHVGGGASGVSGTGGGDSPPIKPGFESFLLGLRQLEKGARRFVLSAPTSLHFRRSTPAPPQLILFSPLSGLRTSQERAGWWWWCCFSALPFRRSATTAGLWRLLEQSRRHPGWREEAK